MSELFYKKIYECRNKSAKSLDSLFRSGRLVYGGRVDTKPISSKELEIVSTYEDELQDALQKIQSLDTED